MNKKMKLIWDFGGEDGLKTAEHHATHLKEFSAKENIELLDIGVETSKVGQSSTYVVVDEKDMPSIRDLLRPKRGQWV